jgi:hypothetical protein
VNTIDRGKPTQSQHVRIHIEVEIDPVEPILRALEGVEDGCIVAVEHHAKCCYHGVVPTVPLLAHLDCCFSVASAGKRSMRVRDAD